MIVGYHASPHFKSEEIIRDLYLKTTRDETQLHAGTQLGFIYFATSLHRAVDFGIRAIGRVRNSDIFDAPEITVFRVEFEAMDSIGEDTDEQTGDEEGSLIERIYQTGSFTYSEHIAIDKINVTYTRIRLHQDQQLDWTGLDRGDYDDETKFNWTYCSI